MDAPTPPQEHPRSAPLVNAAFGVFFGIVAAMTLAACWPLDWRSALAVLFLLALAADLLVASRKKRWPLIMPLLFLP